MKIKTICGLVALLSVSATLFAADATFSADNKHVYLVQYEQVPPRESGACSLIDVDLEKGTCKGIDLRKELGNPIRDVALSNSGFVLCATKSAVWAFDPAKNRCVKVLDAPKNRELVEIGYDPSQQTILATCANGEEQELYFLPDQGNHWIPLYDRRSAGVEFPVFAADGALYFTSRGDLWAGELQAQTDSTVPAWNAFPAISGTSGKWPHSMELGALAAYRCAPLAFLETANTTSDSFGLTDIAASQHFIYGDYARRAGGGGWGSLIRCKRPDKELHGDGEPNGKEAVAELETLETVFAEECFALCSSRDGSLVFFIGKGNKPFLIRDEGEPKPLTLSGLDDLF